MRILIVGGSGLLGSNLAKMGAGRHEIWATYCRHLVGITGCRFVSLDVLDTKATLALLNAIRPEVVINTVALTSVDYCEANREEARELNVEATEVLAIGTSILGCKLVYVSSDYVFDGRVGMYAEEDEPNPLNYYGYTKLMGEEAVRRRNPNHLILRTSLYGWNIQDKYSLAEWILNGLAHAEPLTIYADQYFTPILVNNLARAVYELIELKGVGLYHVAGSERCSKLDFARWVAIEFGYDPRRLAPVVTQDLDLPATRPLDSSLRVDKVQRILTARLLNVAEGIHEMKELQISGYVTDLKRGQMVA